MLTVGGTAEGVPLWLFAGTSERGTNGKLQAMNMDSRASQSLVGHIGGVYCLAQSGSYLFSGGDDTLVHTWQFGAAGQLEPVTKLAGHTQPVQDMKIVGEQLITADRGGTVAIWGLSGETAGQAQLTINTGHERALMALWVEDPYLFTCALDGKVKVWAADGSNVYEHTVTNKDNQPSAITALTVVQSADRAESSVMVTACEDSALKLWCMPTFDRRGIIASRAGHTNTPRCLAKGPGRSFFSGGMDHSIIVWEFQLA
jgi:WD40 repeat protein